MSDSFVLLGLAGARAAWFAAVGQWAHAGSLPVEFVKCVSVEQVRARLSSGRLHSAVLLDGALPAVDRDLIEATRAAGGAILIVDDAARTEQWIGLGADAVVAVDFTPHELLDALRAHAALVPAARWSGRPAPDRPEPADAGPGSLVMLCGPGGTGVSTLAIALAQQLAAERGVAAGRVALVDLCLRAEQGMLHDAGDIGPGVQELVDQCRVTTPDAEQVRAHTYAVTERGYALLLGLRRPSAWAALRPRAVAAALDALRHAFASVVCDVDAEFEGQAEGGSVDVEEHNALARAASTRADVVFAVGLPGLKGVYALARVVGELVDAGLAPTRIVPVVNQMPRGPRSRARIAAALAALLSERVRAELASPVFIGVRDIERALHDRARLPAALGDPLVGAFHAVDARVSQLVREPTDGGARIEPGTLAPWPEEATAR